MTTAIQKIPSGYKQTEIGVIPADWDVKKLGEVADYKNGKSFESRITDIGDYFLITLNSLDIKGKLKSDHLRVSVSDKSLNKNDLVMILSDVAHGNFLGLADVVPEDDKYVLNQRVGALKNIRYLTPYYLSKYINFKQKYFKTAGQGSSQLNLSKGDILAFPVAYPNSETEQSAISMMISDAEVLIEKLERLVEKKKNIKQGAMHELLIRKRRLPEFSGKWEMKIFGQVLKIRHGKSQREVAVVNGKYPILASGGEIGRSNEYLYNKPSVLIGRKGTIDIPQYMDKPFWTVDTLFYTEIEKSNDARFIYYKFQLVDWYLYNEASGVPSLNAKTIERIETYFPPDKSEQVAIANVLSDMDTEIEKLESQLTKYQNIKQGMMQTLLTGKIRLLTK